MYEVERARALIRGLTPITFQFELPGQADAAADRYVKDIQDHFPVIVTFRQIGRNLSYSAFVKGCEKDFERVKEGILILMKNLHGRDSVSGVPVTIQLNITPQHHPTVFGPCNNNLQIIMQISNTHISFPSPMDRVASARRGTLLISGSIDGVFLARQERLKIRSTIYKELC